MQEFQCEPTIAAVMTLAAEGGCPGNSSARVTEGLRKGRHPGGMTLVHPTVGGRQGRTILSLILYGT